MNKTDLKNLKLRMDSFTVFRTLTEDPVVSSLYAYLKKMSVSSYCFFVSKLYSTGASSPGEYINSLCARSRNVFVEAVGAGRSIPDTIRQSVREELMILQDIANLTPDDLKAGIDYDGFLPSFDTSETDIAESFNHRVSNIGKYGYGIYAQNKMFYVNDVNEIMPISNPDSTRFSDLVDYEAQRKIILDNTKALLAGRPASNVLLTGDAGTGKSATVKALANELFEDGLRIIEVRKDQLGAIPHILGELSLNPLKFILFIDDLSFLKDDDNFNGLKAVLEGSVSAKPENVAIYATSNRRHVIKEKFSDRDGDDVHKNDTLSELISLSERFGIQVTFQKPNKQTFLRIVCHLADENGIDLPREKLEAGAERFALERGGRSARLAKQFINRILSGSWEI